MAKPDFVKTEPILSCGKNLDQQLKNTQNWDHLDKIWFGHSISFEILQSECHSRQRFEIGNFSTGCNPKAKF